jgi:hypothetical protein
LGLFLVTAVAGLGVDFEVHEPPELVEHLALWHFDWVRPLAEKRLRPSPRAERAIELQ